MNYEFHWVPEIADAKKTPAEEAIREGQKSGDSPISFCHDGTVVVTPSATNALQKAIRRRHEMRLRQTVESLHGVVIEHTDQSTDDSLVNENGRYHEPSGDAQPGGAGNAAR